MTMSEYGYKRDDFSVLIIILNVDCVHQLTPTCNALGQTILCSCVIRLPL